MPFEKGKYITVGKIVNTRGHRGEVRMMPLTDFPERFTGIKSILVETDGRVERRDVERTYPHGKFIIFKFKSVDDMNTAERLKNAQLLVTRDELTPLPEGSYYIFDIVGLDVFTSAGNHLGKVKDVIQTGANDVYVVEGDAGQQLLIPALKQVVLKIDIEAGKMVVELPEGLEDV